MNRGNIRSDTGCFLLEHMLEKNIVLRIKNSQYLARELLQQFLGFKLLPNLSLPASLVRSTKAFFSASTSKLFISELFNSFLTNLGSN